MKGLHPNAVTAGGTYYGRRSKSSCSFCGDEGHQVTACPHVDGIWRSLSKGVIPLKVIDTLSATNPRFRWYLQGSEWGNLYKLTEKAHTKLSNHRQRQKEKAKSKKSKQVRVKTCGYCGDTGHTRRTCGHLASDSAKLSKANRAFREWVYQDLVERQGLSTGAIVSFNAQSERTYNTEPSEHSITTLVTEVNWDQMNVFSTMSTPETTWQLSQQWSIGRDRLANVAEFFKSHVLAKVSRKPFEDKGIKLQDPYRGYNRAYQEVSTVIGISVPTASADGQPRTSDRNCGKPVQWESLERFSWGAPTINSFEVVSRAPQVLSEDWKDGFTDEMQVIFKKFSRNELTAIGVLEHIEEWAQSDFAI